jgi:acyl-CoA dehydrogenase
MRRTVFNEDHESFRQTLREFIEAEVVPAYPDWLAKGAVPREFYYKLAELGLFGIEVPEEYGGAGISSFKFSAIQTEELARAAVSFGGSSVHSALCLPYLLKLGSEAQKKRWLPPAR